MGNYNSQYKNYYQGLQNKNVRKNNSPVYTRNSFEELYGYNNNKRKKKEFFSSMSNVFIYQLVVVIFMLMASFYLKYAPGQTGAYETYSQVEQEVENFDLSKIVNKISNYIKTSLGGDKVDF